MLSWLHAFWSWWCLKLTPTWPLSGHFGGSPAGPIWLQLPWLGQGFSSSYFQGSLWFSDSLFYMNSHLVYQWYFQMVILGCRLVLSYVAHTSLMKAWILWTSVDRRGAGASQIPELLLAWLSCPLDFQGENLSAVHWVSQTPGYAFRLSNLFLWSLSKWLRDKKKHLPSLLLGGRWDLP